MNCTLLKEMYKVVKEGGEIDKIFPLSLPEYIDDETYFEICMFGAKYLKDEKRKEICKMKAKEIKNHESRSKEVCK